MSRGALASASTSCADKSKIPLRYGASMAQIFHPSTNTLSRLTIFGGALLLAALVMALAEINRSFYITEVGVARIQPVPFSHKHHVGDDGIDCR